MKATFTNNFHNTEVTVHSKRQNTAHHSLSKGQVRKIRKALCGIKGCTCGHDCLKSTDKYWVVYEEQDGGATFRLEC